MRPTQDGEQRRAAEADAEPTQAAAASPPMAPHGASWRDHWYPVAFERDLRRDEPYAFTLFGEPLVAFRGDGGRWFCGPDRCPHRAARLSEGRVRDGRLECLYHGWQFGADGRCRRIPQWPPERPLPAAACLSAIPLQVRQGMLWVWPGGAHQADPARIPVVPALEAKDVVVTDYAIDLPYGQSFLVENVIDVAHIHIAHDGVRGGGFRDLALPLQFELLDESATGLRASYRSIGLPSRADAGSQAGRALVEFVAPNLVLYTSDYADRSRVAGLALYSLPLDTDRCRLLYRKFSNFYSRRERAKPRWLEHWTQNEILRQDMALIVGQHDEIRRSTGELADLWLPLKTSDTLVIRYRKWLDEHAADRPDHRGFTSHRAVEHRTGSGVEAFDVHAMHTRQCRDCSRMLTGARRARTGLRLALVLGVPAMALGGTVVQVIGLTTYLLGALGLWGIERFVRRF